MAVGTVERFHVEGPLTGGVCLSPPIRHFHSLSAEDTVLFLVAPRPIPASSALVIRFLSVLTQSLETHLYFAVLIFFKFGIWFYHRCDFSSQVGHHTLSRCVYMICLHCSLALYFISFMGVCSPIFPSVS